MIMHEINLMSFKFHVNIYLVLVSTSNDFYVDLALTNLSTDSNPMETDVRYPIGKYEVISNRTLHKYIG